MKKQPLIIILFGFLVLQLIYTVFAEDSTSTTNQNPSLTEEGQTQVVILADTPVYLRLMQSVTSGEAMVSTEIKYQVIREVRSDDGKVLIPYHAEAYGVVIDSRKHKLTGPGEIVISLDRVIGFGNKIIPIQRHQEAKGGYHVLFLGFALIAVYEEATIPENSLVKAYVVHDTEIKHPDKSLFDSNSNQAKIQIEMPLNNAIYKKGAPVDLFCNIYPQQNIDYVRLWFDSKVIYEQKGEPEIVTVKDKSLKRGNYSVIAEARFVSGETIKSEPVKITVK